MQISTLNGASGVAANTVDETVKPADVDSAASAPASTAATSGGTATPLRSGLSRWDDQLQGEISNAQQTLDFLDQSASQLQALKSEVAAKLAAQASGREGQVEARLRQFSKTWNTRQTATAGSLNDQLDYSSPAPASQSFTVRGMNLASLQSGGKEVLAFSVGTANQTLSSVTIETGMSATAIVNGLDQALAPAQIRASTGSDGSIVFRTPESVWPTVRDTLSVRGSGVRFPTGQMNRVKTDTEAPAITPEGWSGDDSAQLRQTLNNVIAALGRIQQARASVSQALASASTRVASAQVADIGAGMDSLAANFNSTTSGGGYDALVSIASALVGISRERVVSLLSIK